MFGFHNMLHGRDTREVLRAGLKARVNAVLDCCAETARIYICRGPRWFERTLDRTEQLIFPKYSCRATDDHRRTCCHRGCAGVNQAATKEEEERNTMLQELPQSFMFVMKISIFQLKSHTDVYSLLLPCF